MERVESEAWSLECEVWILLTFQIFWSKLSLVLPRRGRRFPLHRGQSFLPPIEREGVVDMVTWQELFQFGIFLIALISLIIQDKDKKK